MNEKRGMGPGLDPDEGGVVALVTRTLRFLRRDQWQIDAGGLSRVRAVGLRIIRIASLAWHGLERHDVLTRASALTYITVLSVVPLLAFSFSVAKGLGAYEYLRETAVTPFLDDLTPAGASDGTQIRDAVERVLDFVSRTNFANLGLVGLGALIFTTIRLMSTVEGTFNIIWEVQRARPWVRKITDFVTIVIISPMLLLIATAATAALQASAAELLPAVLRLGPLMGTLARLVPLVMVWLGFSFVYMIMPNTRVPLWSAVVGGVVGGSVWELVQVLHIQLQVGVARYNALYAGFAAIPIFLAWVYMNWVAVLLGALVGRAHEVEPSFRQRWRLQALGFTDRERAAIRGLAEVARTFEAGRGGAPLVRVAAASGVPPGVVPEVLQPFLDAGFIARHDDHDQPGFLATRPPSAVRMSMVLRALWEQRGEPAPPIEGDPVSEATHRLWTEVEGSPHNLTLRELVDRLETTERLDRAGAPAAASPPPR